MFTGFWVVIIILAGLFLLSLMVHAFIS